MLEEFRSKLPDSGTTIFTVMSALAKEHNAINLSQGFPDFDCDEKLIALANHYIASGFNQYAPMAGVLPLRERVSQIIEKKYNHAYDPESEITITAGATQGIFTTIAAFVRPGDEVIVLEPAYDCYVPAILVNGGIPVFSKLGGDDFRIDWDDVCSKITRKTRAIIINSPHNPSGAIIGRSDLAELEKLVAGTNILIISDEVYEHIVFDGHQHRSVSTSKILADQSIVISSFGKTVHTTGWKIGYAAARKRLMAEFRKVHQFLVFVVNHPLQLALADFLADPTTYTELSSFYEKKRNLFLELTKSSRFRPLPCKGTYFQLMSYESISREKDTEMAVRLTKEKKLAAIPLSVFYKNNEDRKLLRFCFAKRDETLKKAAEIICSL
jgi:methionine aminotransferase